MNYKPVVRGILSFLPGFLQLLGKGKGAKGTFGTSSARYCYSVWLRHLIHLKKSGMSRIPKSVAELGPGDTIGIGLMALLSGSQKYFSFDVIQHANNNRNQVILLELVKLLKERTPIPNHEEFPLVRPLLDDYSFPDKIFSKEDIEALTSKKRITALQQALEKGRSSDFYIKYIVPWDSDQSIELKNSVDLIFSQAVMEHLEFPSKAYYKMAEWLNEDGFISHVIDYSAHETHSIWNGHWFYNQFIWKIIMHGRPYLINRLPHSAHIEFIEDAGFTIVNTELDIKDGLFAENESSFKYTQDDYQTRKALIQAKIESSCAQNSDL